VYKVPLAPQSFLIPLSYHQLLNLKSNMLLLSLTLFSLFQGLSSQAVSIDANGVSTQEKYEALERSMMFIGGLESLVTPCSSFTGGSGDISGEQTSAEWIRVSLALSASSDMKPLLTLNWIC